MTWSLVRVTEPDSPVISTAEAKLHLRIDHSDEDTLIDRIVEAATNQCEEYQGRAYVTQEFRLTVPRFPFYGRIIRLPRPPLQSVTSIEYLDVNGDVQTLDASMYRVNTDGLPGQVIIKDGESWPNTVYAPDAVRITYTAGYGEPADVPADYRSAILLMVGHLYENREVVTVGSGPTFKLSLSLEWMLSKNKVVTPDPIGAR